MFYNINLYVEDLKSLVDNYIPIEQLKKSNVLITGASGMIGSFLVDVLMFYNEILGYNINVFALARNRIFLEKRFRSHRENSNFHIIQHDIINAINFDKNFDYIIHAAGNAYPQAFSTDPVGTIIGNVCGTYHLLEYARQHYVKRVLLISSGEVYGQATERVNAFEESYSGYVDITNPRSCYPNGKRAAETLCVSYTKQHGIDTVIARPCHIYGPTSTIDDNRVSTQFIYNVLAGNDILMKSQGLQLRSYCYVADCVSAIITILLRGERCNAYNIANSNSSVTIRELADIIASISGKKVIFELPNEIEKASYNPVMQSVLDSRKLEGLGWSSKYNMKKGLQRTIDILREF